MLNGHLNALITEFPDYDVVGFVKRVFEQPSFGASGIWTFFCNKCGGQWSFDLKVERKLFERLHKGVGCNIVLEVNQDTKKNSTTAQSAGEMEYKLPGFFLKRGTLPIHQQVQNIQEKEPDNVIEDAQAALPSEPAIAGAE